jgi:fimbrial isopeptide formation D2 family protein/uncharacterized repeat protein (TIGR02543 family)
LLNTTIANNNVTTNGGGIHNSGIFTMLDGTIANNTAGSGGGIYTMGTNGNVTVFSGTIANNAANYGGGVYNSGGSFGLSGGVVANNLALCGGGVYNVGSFELSGLGVISSNVASDSGGGIHNVGSGNVTILGGVVANNTALENGGGINNGGSLTMSNGIITSNTANAGGGISNNGTFSLSGGEILNNTASQGGGIYDRGSLSILNGTISNNSASQSGGGVHINSLGYFSLSGGLISNNTAFYNTTIGSGGGVYNEGRFIMSDSGMISGNAAAYGGGMYNNGSFSLSGGTISSNTAADAGGGVYATADTDSILFSGVISGNKATERGGGILSAGNFTLIDCIVSNNVVVKDGGGVYNFGNFTLSGGIISNNTAGDNDNEGYGGGIFNKPFLGLSFNMFNALILDNNSTYRGGGVYSDVGVFNVFGDSRISGNIANDIGGGIYNYGTFSLYDGEISNNTAYSYDTPRGGGGVYNGAYFSMFNGAIFNNTAVNGGGVYNFGNTFALSGGTIYNNTASTAGGGVYNTGTSSIFNASGGLIFENKANVAGGGVYLNSGNFTATDVIISDNTAELNGGGVYLAGGSMKLSSSAISNNIATDGGGVYMAGGLVDLFSGLISDNTASDDGGGVWVAYVNMDKLFVYDGMIFSNNSASIAYDRNPIDDTIYYTQIEPLTVWTTPFIQGYNNYDISYTNGTPFTLYTVTVNNSYAPITGADTYIAGVNVTINAGTLTGYTFTDWTVNQGNITLPNTPTATFTMPPNDVTVTANWQTSEYTIFYNANSGSGAMASTPAAFKDFVTLSTTEFSRDDHVFIGWNTETDGSGTTFGNEATFNYTYTDDLTLYAVWVVSGGVSKVVDGGSGSYGAGEGVSYVVSYTLPSNLSSVESFEIVDIWAPAGGLTFVDAVVTVGGDVLSAPGVNLTVSVGQVSFVFDPAVLVAGAEVEIALSFTVADVSVGISNVASVIINGVSTGSGGAGLYRVVYASGGASGSVPVDSVLYESGESVVVLSEGALSLGGSSFIGWFYNGTVYTAGESFVISEDVELWAVWGLLPDPNVYTISYVLNGGINVNGNPRFYVVGNLPLEIANPYRAGYTFLYWTALYANGTECILIDSIIPRGVHGDIQLTAYWRSDSVYTISYELDGGVNAVGNPVSYVVDDLPLGIVDPSRAGYAFAGWIVTYADGSGLVSQFSYSIPVGTVGDILLRAIWRSESEIYNILYALEGGVNAADNPSSYTLDVLPLAIADPTRDGHEFLGWMVEYADGSTIGPVLSFSIPEDATGNIILVANWAESSAVGYTVIYNGNGHTSGAVPIDNNNPYVSGSQVTVLGQGALSRNGYTFLGWATSASATSATYRAGSTFTITSDVALYAVWSRSESSVGYSISYRYTGQVPSGAPLVPASVSGVSAGAARQIAGIPVLTGYTFSGWSSPDVTVNGGSFVMPNRNVAFSGSWSAKVYTVNYNVNGGDFAVDSRFVVWTELGLLSLVVPVRANYTFEGWFFEGFAITEDARFCDLVKDDGVMSVTLEARWSSLAPDIDVATGSWAVVNLILCVLGVIVTLFAGAWVLVLGRRRGSGVRGLDAGHLRLFRLGWFLAIVVLGVVGVLVFLLTQNLSQPMGVVDQWSVLNGVIFAFEALGLFFIFYPKPQATNQKTL